MTKDYGKDTRPQPCPWCTDPGRPEDLAAHEPSDHCAVCWELYCASDGCAWAVENAMEWLAGVAL